jgi:CelD/BcsL family acetyltransferase involved in cellulose biosynthesis
MGTAFVRPERKYGRPYARGPQTGRIVGEPLSFEIGRPPDLAELGAMWRALQARAEHAFFLDWGWIGVWLAEAPQSASILIGRAGGEVVLLGALMPSARRDVLPVPVHGLHLHDTGQDALDVITIEYNGFLVDRAWQGRAEAQAVRFMLQGQHIAGRRRDELHLKGVAGGFDTTGFGEELATTVVSRQPSWLVDLGALRADGQGYLAGLSANTRYQIRRSMRLYAERGPLIAEAARTAEEGLAYLDALKALHQRYWTRRGEPGAFGFPFFERFQRRLITECLPLGMVELLRVRAGSEDIGYLYNFVHAGRVLSYQSGFHYEADPRLKPGLVSHTMCIERHVRDGAAFYDFLAGDARYKASLGTPGPEMVYLRVERSTVVLRLERALKSVMRHATRAVSGRRED